ncbi:DUF2634 domain-containing protein [Marinicrinis sediminis]|uniref:DUF2634 domain-containing protein n=1 Tax=Marinicrinis sediminis TaxID=1652465 RepID=A0ABW5R8D2_9BACL
MALTPFSETNTNVKPTVSDLSPSQTYGFDFDRGTFTGRIQGMNAIRQWINKALLTARNRFLIYDDQYGSELEELLESNSSSSLIRMEIPRLIKEALIYDERIIEVRDFQLTEQPEGWLVSFTVETNAGVINEEVRL